MNAMIDVETIYRQERQRWLREEAPRKSVRDVIAQSVPYWIILVALVLYGLSAPHTASVFDKLTPGWGWIAPIGVEFGLLYSAFRRRFAKARQERLPWTLWALEVLLFLTAMLVNGAGAFTSVVTVTQIDMLSFAAIVERFGNLPAASQAALIMAGLAAFIIPIGALVAGEGLAALVLEQRTGEDYRDQKWQEVEFTLMYRAVFVRYLQQGMVEKDARQRAASEVKGYLGKGYPSAVQLLSAGSGQGEQKANGQGDSVKQRVNAYLDSNPDLVQQSVNQVLVALRASGIQAGRTTVAEVLHKRKQAVSA
ncbi:MAG: hypothetical protein ABI947_07065 [Chloroflexota bacterium]